jgi:ubiquinone/menaquinone biosynthesis C-methylase UbiE
MKYFILKIFLKTIGKLSDGVKIGWRTGFDSGVMLEYIYENKPRGFGPIGRFLDKLYISNEVWDGVRSRREFLIKQIQEAVASFEKPQLYDLAAGMGSYLFFIDRDKANITAGDFEPEAVHRGNGKVSEAGRHDIKFVEHNAFNKDSYAVQEADILVSSGFFDILVKDEEIKTILKNGSEITKKGSKWVFTIQEHHPDLEMIKKTMIDLHKGEWELVPRKAEVLTEWAKEYGWELVKLERNEFFAVGTMVKK